MSTRKYLTMVVAGACGAAALTGHHADPLLAQASATLIVTASRDIGQSGRAINDGGQVAGSIRNNINSIYRPAVWTAATGWRDLGFEGWATAINSKGHVVGYWKSPTGVYRGFLWSEETGMMDLPFPCDADILGSLDVNDSDMTVATCSSPRVQYAWSPTLGVRVVATDGFASAVNNSGVVVGYVRNEAYRWTASGGLHTLSPGYECMAEDINNLGDIVGSCSGGNAVLWQASGGIVNLGGGTAEHINDRGMVVGKLSFAPSTINRDRAFVWTAVTGRFSLADEAFSVTIDINNLGQVVVRMYEIINTPGPPFVDPTRTSIYQIRVAAAATDVDSDARGDFIFQHRDGGLGTWLMNGTSLREGRLLSPPTVDPAWRVVGTPDADGDRGIDLLFRHDDGRMAMWELSGTNLRDGYMLQPDRAENLNWRICGTGDIDADGNGDVYWHHIGDGSLAVWMLRGGRLIDGRRLDPARIERPWDVIGVGDVNGDQSPDLVLQNGVTGALAVWMMAGQTLVDASFVSRSAPAGWRLGAIRDLNSDGPADLAWQGPNGELVVWFMRGAQVLSIEAITPFTIAEGWQMVGPR